MYRNLRPNPDYKKAFEKYVRYGDPITEPPFIEVKNSKPDNSMETLSLELTEELAYLKQVLKHNYYAHPKVIFLIKFQNLVERILALENDLEYKHHSHTQPRVGKGRPDGGQWTKEVEEFGTSIRDKTHNLVVREKNELDNPTFLKYLKEFLLKLEGVRNEGYIDGILDPSDQTKFISTTKYYSLDKATQNRLWKEAKAKRNKDKRRDLDDPRGKPIHTVGVGANIDSAEARKKFDKLLGTPGLMDDVCYGRKNLNDAQVNIVLDECLKERHVELRKVYGEDWKKLRANEKIAISSLFFNGPLLAGGGTRFRQNIKNYAKTNDVKYLKQAVDEVVNKSNPGNVQYVQNRRNAEGALLASYKSPKYTKPNESPDSK